MWPDKPTPCLEDSVLELVRKLSCGNPGAVLILCKIVGRHRDPYSLLLDMDDLELTGSRVWEAYKDLCREDLEELVRRVRDRIIYN